MRHPRRGRRGPLSVPVEFCPLPVVDSRVLRGETRDVSSGGAQLWLPECLPRLLVKGSAVKSQRLMGAEGYAQDIQSVLRLAESRAQLFDGLSDSQIQRCLNKSSAIECRKGDRLIKKGNVARNMFVVLSGTLEIRDGDVLVGVSSAGDIVGEMAFLLESPRSMDVYAATEDVSVLSLSEAVIKEITQEDPKAAARLLLHVSKMLCYKLLGAGA
ncbi:MAG: cyclic nucleotide-binding domain-containing protein [Nitrospinae bacterium]|nr:cyclic nucleotide-binding domain-containing protein [Nitrospinota bacterium]